MDVQCGPDSTAPVYSMLSATTSLTKVSKMFTAGIRIGDSAADTKITSTDFGTRTNDANNSYRTIIPRNRSVGIKIKDSNSNIVVNGMQLSYESTYSALSATASLTRMPNVLAAEIKVGCSKTDNDIKYTDFEACTNTSELICNSYYPMERSVDFTIKDSMSIIPKRLEFSTDTDAPFEYKTSISKVSTVFKSLPSTSLNKDPEKNVPMNMECSTNTQDLYDKLIISSQQLFKNEIEILKEPCVELELMNFSTNLPNRINSQESCDESNSLSKPTFQKQKSPIGIQKESVDFKLQDSVSHIPKRVKCLTIAQKRPCDKPIVSSLKTTSEVILMDNFEPKSTYAIYDSDPKLLTELQSLTDTEFNDFSRTLSPSPPTFARQTLLTKLAETVIDIEDPNSNSPEKQDGLVNQEVNGKLNSSQAFPEDTTLLLSQRELKIDDSMSNIYVSVESACKTLTCNSLDNNDLQVVSATNNRHDNSGKTAKNVKRKLCRGGVQVHSYRDQQALSEDIMYQGKWQQNNPKVLARKKHCIPVVFKKIDFNVKKNELKNSSRLSSNDKNCNNNKVKNDLKPEIRQPLLMRNTIIRKIKQESDIQEKKQGQKRPNTTCAGTIAKPFRNILKVSIFKNQLVFLSIFVKLLFTNEFYL